MKNTSGTRSFCVCKVDYKKYVAAIVCIALVAVLAIPMSQAVFAPHEKNLPAPASRPKSVSSGSAHHPVNPLQWGTTEPSAMGIADFGIGPTPSQWYNYSTTDFLGTLNITSLTCKNATSGATSLTVQLNVVLEFSDSSGNKYYYWIQNVPVWDTSTHAFSVDDNIWNFSVNSTNPPLTGVTGKGQISHSSGGDYYWCTVSGQPSTITAPFVLQVRVVSLIIANHPHVLFEDNEGSGWYTMDNVTFASKLGTDMNFVVCGYEYCPLNPMFANAELTFGGDVDTYVPIVTSNIHATLEYWNGHNYQSVVNAYNCGGDTAEGVSNVIDTFGHSSGTGGVYGVLVPGGGTLGPLYNRSQVGLLNVSVPGLASGTLYVNNSAHAYQGNDVNLTLAPGNYHLILYNGASIYWQDNITLTGGQYLFIIVGGSVPEFTFSPIIITSVLIITAIVVRFRKR